MIEENKHNPITLLNEAKNDLEEDDFFRGWKRGCKEYLLKINGKWRLNLQEVLDF